MVWGMLIGAFVALHFLFRTCTAPRSLMAAMVVAALVGLGGAQAAILISKLISP